MEIITSKSNPKYLLACKLKQKKYREELNLVLIEGEKLILEAFHNGIEIEMLLACEEKIDSFKQIHAKETYILSLNLCKNLSSMVTSQNVFAVAKIPQANKTNSQNVLVLDKIQNPDNLGAIIRSAVATNFVTIYAIESVDLYNEKTLRSSMGNVFKVNFIKTDYQHINSLLKDYQVCIADMQGENIFKLNSLQKNVALVIGNEGNGVSEQMRKLCNKKISIPMQNNVESLNASVSAGIIMYQIIDKQGE